VIVAIPKARRPMPPPRARCELWNDVSARRPMQTGSTNAVSQRGLIHPAGRKRRAIWVSSADEVAFLAAVCHTSARQYMQLSTAVCFTAAG
jgi:hypothetical protein